VEIKYHNTVKGITIAEVLPGSDVITSPDEMLDIIADVGYHKSSRLIVYDKNLHPDFFDLKSRLAGEILQKFSNYRMKLAIVGDFSGFKSKSLRDFIRESNRTGIICFVDTLDEALLKLDH
jgi:hypothetical protein